MSAIIFSVPLQSLVLTVNDLTIVSINALLLNFKFLLMSAMLLSIWNHGHNLHAKEVPDQASNPSNPIEQTLLEQTLHKKSGLTFISKLLKKLKYMISLHFLCSSTYMVSMTRPDKDNWSFYLGVSIPSYITAIIATVLRFLTFDIAYDCRYILKNAAHIVLPIHFLCLTIKRKQEKRVILATYLGILLSPLVTRLGMFSIFAWLIIATLIYLVKYKQCGSK
ncbi:MAG: hypothetical protein NMK33_05385 [Candidatus Cardinium sp.]|uniref:hypothetical protein n=1 Tax=Cardinium endosymbiont of Dermatophagoides farinae TaxID=2597823 RepID=UPI001642CD35|nr:hypothetical protein [Cardinium endosymbiont of Dermatophagoides farinae]UWW96850.1 MAG: hypothetical protein NMK33_05385 [Candidatus Cardinium sp.]